MPDGPITLTTDFGLADPYVAQMKGVILSIEPSARIVDVSHQIGPQDVLHGAFVLASAASSFPAGTIHVAVVDPGVGTERAALVVEGARETFVLPDNGLVTLALEREGGGVGEGPGSGGPAHGFAGAQSAGLPPGWRAVALTNPDYWRHPVSATFHGRDIFAPVAAHLARGVPAERLGEPVGRVTVLGVPQPAEREGALVGHVLRVDGFGNLITTVPGRLVPAWAEVEVGGHVVRGLSHTYGGAAGLIALVGSHGNLEIALPGGDASALVGRGAGTEVTVRL